MVVFIDRDDEMRTLLERFDSNRPELIVIYGKRRVGKTELVKHVLGTRKGVYLLADKRSDRDLLLEFSKTMGAYFNDLGMEMSGAPDWITFFRYIAEMIGKERMMLVFDEFPYLTQANKAIPSLFQKGWDEHLSRSNVLMVLMGSSISMMERGVLAYKSPLYGRRTGQFLLGPMDFQNSREFSPGRDLVEQIENYAVLGGMPAYQLQFDFNKPPLKNIRDNILKKDSFLYDEVEFVLKEELREPRIYFTILKEMALGRTTVNEISQVVGLDRNRLSKYLSTLERLRIIKRELPVTLKDPHRSRKGVYVIEENFFKFWFEFVFPNRGRIEAGHTDLVLKRIEERFDSYVSRSFESICMEAVKKGILTGKDDEPLVNVGRWWQGEEEIDIVALNEETKEVLFAECKWQRGKVGADVATDLLRKAELVEWMPSNRNENYAIFSRSGFKVSCRKFCDEKGIRMFDLDDIQKTFGA